MMVSGAKKGEGEAWGGGRVSPRGGDGLRHSPPPGCSLFIVHGGGPFPSSPAKQDGPRRGTRKRGIDKVKPL